MSQVGSEYLILDLGRLEASLTQNRPSPRASLAGVFAGLDSQIGTVGAVLLAATSDYTPAVGFGLQGVMTFKRADRDNSVGASRLEQVGKGHHVV